ncbi:Protein CBG24173 [Caenorhabditis briggsae]|uniref:Protein CBG24173 n=1 Tax=Caenorhabditis briggsae TaxID=6238 RepID=A8WK49_CAEBR|nr:Protein CBG24173 [Caenorhabditis briggsae]CAP20842.1 Protein CBG24173 [Caenorhabditis briggsae]
MKILHSLIILASIFSLVQASIFDALNEFYDGWGEEQCVQINNRRSPQATPLTALEIPFGGFFDGFLDSINRSKINFKLKTHLARQALRTVRNSPQCTIAYRSQPKPPSPLKNYSNPSEPCTSNSSVISSGPIIVEIFE